MVGIGRLQLIDLFTELPVPPQAAGVVGTFNVFFFIILSTTVSVLDLKDDITFLQGLSRFVCVHSYYLFASTLCMGVMYLTSFDGFF